MCEYRSTPLRIGAAADLASSSMQRHAHRPPPAREPASRRAARRQGWGSREGAFEASHAPRPGRRRLPTKPARIRYSGSGRDHTRGRAFGQKRTVKSTTKCCKARQATGCCTSAPAANRNGFVERSAGESNNDDRLLQTPFS